VIGAASGPAESARTTHFRIGQWAAPTFEIDSDRPVPAGIDGEATVLQPPLRFRILTGALRARIAADHPGASPSALEPDSPLQTLVVLAELALGRSINLPAQ